MKAGSKSLRFPELLSIALGGMVGGGIFSILGISVEKIGNAAPVAIAIGGLLAFFAAYSYVKLTILYKDEGATYSFFKKTFPNSKFASSVIGWLVVFGYISTLALYAFTFASYLGSVLPFGNSIWVNKVIAGLIIGLFALINIVSVKGMGKLEDWMVYLKLIILVFISGILAGKGEFSNVVPMIDLSTDWSRVFMIAAITFVAYEGFQLVIHAYNEVEAPLKNIPKAIYGSIIIATLLYVTLAIASLSALPKEAIIEGKEYALAAGAEQMLGISGRFLVIFGALLATSSAISGTLFGASRLMAVIANDGYLPRVLGKKIKTHIPVNAILLMAMLAMFLIIAGGLQMLLEFGSITFILVSILMAVANFKMRKVTDSHVVMTIIAILGLFAASILIFYFEYTENPEQLVFIGIMYVILAIGAYLFAHRHR